MVLVLRTSPVSACRQCDGLPPSSNSSRDRIAVLDILRGIAILLIFLFNIPEMGNSVYGSFGDGRVIGWGPADRICWAVLNIFLEGTQRGLLQLLFGASALILLEKAMDPDGPVKVADLYFRRNLWLAMFGLLDIYGLLWFGDILFSYSLAALFLFPFRRFAGKALLAISLAFVAGKGVQGVFQFHHAVLVHREGIRAHEKQAHHELLNAVDRQALAEREKALAPTPPALLADERTARLGSFRNYVSWMIDFSTGTYSHELLPWLPRLIRNFDCLLLGMALFKFGITQGWHSKYFYLSLAIACYAPGLLLRAISVWQQAAFDGSPNIGVITGEMARLAVTVGHLALINLAIKVSFGRRLLAPFKAAGRTAFSLYLMQNFLGMLVLFPGFGFGLWGRFGRFGLTMIALAVIAVQLVLANVWLRFFMMGPLEWVWRSLTYRRLEPFRLRSVQAGLMAV